MSQPPRGTYHPEDIITDSHCLGVRLIQPMEGRDNACAHAVYYWLERHESSGLHVYQLHHIEEWLPPMSPQEKSRQFTDSAELPPLTPDGRIDFAAIKARREREWDEHERQP